MRSDLPLALIASLACLFAGCDASFEDLRPAGATTPLTDDPLAGGASSGGGETTGDTTTADAELPEPGEERLVLQGQMMDAGYAGEGTVSLFLLADGSWELRFEDDFAVDSVPGPVVVLSVEETLGSRIDPERGDLELGVLAQDTGASSYALPFPPGPRMVAWVYCKPFGLTVARALLMEP